MVTARERRRIVARYALGQRRHLVGLLILTAAASFSVALQPLSLKLFIDNGLGGRAVSGFPAALMDRLSLPNDQRSVVLIAAIVSLLAAVLVAVLSEGVSAYWDWIGERMTRDVSRDAFDQLQTLSPLFHARHDTAGSLSLVTTDAACVYTATNSMLVAPVSRVATLATVAWSAWILNDSLSILAFAAVPLLVLASRVVSRRLKQQAKRARTDRVGVASFVQQVVDSLPVVQAYTAEPLNVGIFRSLAHRSRLASQRLSRIEATADSTTALAGAAAAAVVLVAGGRGVLRGQATAGDLVVFMAYVRTIDRQIRALLAVGRKLRVAEAGLDQLAALFGSIERVSDPAEPVDLPPAPRGSSIEWDDVTFAYVSGRPVLEHVTLRLEPGETVAIVGPTGSGKTTMSALASRLFDPDSGRVLLDGLDVRTLRIADVRSRVAVVRQDPLILPISVASNLAIARPSATRRDIEQAAEAALAAGFIAQLPEGYDTILAGNAAQLSGGERQRLAIARMMLKPARLLVLDEPTSALDPVSEAMLIEALRRAADRCSVLVIAHRLSTIRHADRVAVLGTGGIMECGTHDALLAAGGTYARYLELSLAGATG